MKGRLRGLALAVALLALCALALSAWATAAAQTPTDTTLVSTLGQTTSSSLFTVGVEGTSRFIIAQKFSTGGQSTDSYTLSKAVVHIGNIEGSPTFRVSIYSEVSGNPSSSLYVLTNPASISQGQNTFTAPNNATLNGDTDYFIVLESTASSGSFNIRVTESDDEEGLTGWEVSNERHFNINGGAWHSTGDEPLRFSLVSTSTTDASLDATLSGLTLSDGTADIDLNETFDSATTSYTADVAHSVTSVTVAPTTNDSGANFELLDENNMTLTDADSASGRQVNLAEGENTIKVKVTSAAGTTTRTYTVTITRDGPALVSNLGQTDSSAISRQVAQPFSTGSNSPGYPLASVVVDFGSTVGSADASDVLVRIAPNGDGGGPDFSDTSKVFTLTNPTPVTANATNSFTAPSGATLDAGTTYHVVVTDSGKLQAPGLGVMLTSSKSEDGGKAADWSIGNVHYNRTHAFESWVTDSTGVVKIRINGTIVPPSTDETLSDLRITGTPVETQFTPDFAPRTTSYTAKVANSASTITVKPTTNHEDASVEYLDGSNNTVADADDSAGGHQVNVAEGDNTIKVKVTAEDGTTTRTYTVTVTRTPSVTFWTATLDVNTVVAPAVGCDEVNLFPDYKCSYALSENEFTLGSTTYTVWRFIHPVRSRTRKTLYLKPNTLVIPEGSNLTLHADATPLPFVQADRATSADETVRFIWHETGNQWSSGDTVQLRITGSGLNAAFESPQTVDGVGDSIRYQLDLKLSEPVQIPHAEMRDHAFDVTNGTVVKAKRVARFQREHQGRRRMFSDHWRITVEPTDPDKNVTVVLQGKNCNQRGAVCNPYGDGLLTSPSIELEAPEVPLSVVLGAASANEDQGYLDFPVTLTRETKDFVEINFNSFEGFGQGVIPATAGEDFVPVTGGLRLFAPGETSIVIRVNLINDDVAEETERVGVKLTAARLVNPENLRVKGPVTISFGEAFGEILDTDPTQ